MVISGDQFQHVINDKINSKLFCMLSCLCRTVIIYRSNPIQKAEAVNLNKKKLVFKPTTMAIGDGANDVAMI